MRTIALMGTSGEPAAIKAALLKLAMETSRSGGEHVLTPYREEIVAAIDAGVSAERIGGLLSERLKRKISKDSVWRFGRANGARRKRHPRTS